MPEQKTLVMKFGGTSVGSSDALGNAAQIIRDAKMEWSRVVVVTSAMSGVTDLLLDSASLAAQGKVDSLPKAESALREKHFSTADALIKDDGLREQAKQEIDALILSLMDLCKAIAVLGERMSVRLLAALVNDAGVQARGIESTEFIGKPRFQALLRRVRSRNNSDLLFASGSFRLADGAFQAIRHKSKS